MTVPSVAYAREATNGERAFENFTVRLAAGEGMKN
jgi:hypothetical protein